MSTATQALFGVSQIGSWDQEETQVKALVAHPRAAEAIGFRPWASDYLHERPPPSEDDLAAVVTTAAALAP